MMIVNPFVFGAGDNPGGGAWSPSLLFAAGEAGAYLKSLPEHCWQDTAGTIAAGVGDLVARRDDLSGNGNHQTSSGSARPTLQQDAGGFYYLQYSTSGANRMGGPPITVETTFTLGMSLLASSGRSQQALTGVSGSIDELFFVAQSGSTSTAVYTSMNAQPSLRANGVAASHGTRGEAWTALTNNQVFLWEGGEYRQEWDNNTRLWGDISNSGWELAGRDYGGVEVFRAITTDERTSLETWLGALQGLEL